ncbi:PHP domain-containing protein [Gilvimarinus agarilyticus]|uniref:PHP domain-containing protein n=1 Tax=Gilvimarinus agarilyticus TaxID=679259 RepID=UPI0005A1A719|nr:PHP domain-containing protein [Gilvimarinus agarilyticus]
MKIDLHMHSSCSDGELTPEALVARAKEAGLDVIALTDHDTVEGLARARLAAESEGLTLINGIEFSSRWGKIGVHVVGLGLDATSEALQEAVAAQQAARVERNLTIASRLEKLGAHNIYQRAVDLAGGTQIGRPHFAQLLVEDGLVKSVASAFKKYLGAGKVGDIRQQWPPLIEIIGVIRAAGGVAVLAHPAKYRLTRTKLRALINDFTEAGGGALEVISGYQPSGLARDLAAMANEAGLASSCGSDFHRPGGVWQELGRFEAMPTNARPVWSLWPELAALGGHK